MEISIKFDTVKSEWSIVYIEGSKVIIKKREFRSLKQKAAFHLGLHCLPMYHFRSGLTHMLRAILKHACKTI